MDEKALRSEIQKLIEKFERACPPEDVGGVYGYEEFLKIIQNPKHKEHKSMVKWVGGKFDPEQFDVNETHFNNPDKRLKMIMS